LSSTVGNSGAGCRSGHCGEKHVLALRRPRSFAFDFGDRAFIPRTIFLVLVVGGVIAITQAQTKIPVQLCQPHGLPEDYQGGPANYMPLRVKLAGASCRLFLRNPSECFRPVCTCCRTPCAPFLQKNP